MPDLEDSRQVAPVVNPAFQALLSVQVVLVLEWIVLLVLTSKSAQPVTIPMANKPTTLAMPTV
jgi:hypothetical protein